MKEGKKKIIFVITKSNWGGAQRYVFDMATNLSAKGYNIVVATGGRQALYHKLKSTNIKVVEIPHMGKDVRIKDEIKAIWFLYKLFKKERPDVVHLNSSKAGLGALAGRIARIQKIIFTLHGLATNESRPRLQKSIIKILYSITIILAHKTIAVSNALKDQVTKEFPTYVSSKIIVIKNGILPPTFLSKHDARQTLIKSIPHSETSVDIKIASFTIGTIGELHPIKGHDHLLEGFRGALSRSALPLYLFIIGDGQNKEQLHRQIDDLRLQNNVFLCGHVEEAETTLKAFDIFILPSLSEGLPYALQEAGLAGLPTIASNVGGIPEIIEHKQTGLLIDSASSTDITHAILELVYEPHLRKEVAANLHKKISTEFSLEKMVTETEAIYN